jgi:hypothetical protein
MSNTANTILNQLGGNRFAAMTGSKNFVSMSNDALGFKLSKNNTKANYINITLNGSDLYDIEFRKITVKSNNLKESFKDVHVENLVETFENATGLYTRF